MVFKSTSGFSTYTNTPYLVGSCAIYTHRVSIILYYYFFSNPSWNFLSSWSLRLDRFFFPLKLRKKQFFFRSGNDSFIVGLEKENQENMSDIKIWDRKIASGIITLTLVQVSDFLGSLRVIFIGHRNKFPESLNIISCHHSIKNLKAVSKRRSSIFPLFFARFHIFTTTWATIGFFSSSFFQYKRKVFVWKFARR